MSAIVKYINIELKIICKALSKKIREDNARHSASWPNQCHKREAKTKKSRIFSLQAACFQSQSYKGHTLVLVLSLDLTIIAVCVEGLHLTDHSCIFFISSFYSKTNYKPGCCWKVLCHVWCWFKLSDVDSKASPFSSQSNYFRQSGTSGKIYPMFKCLSLDEWKY